MPKVETREHSRGTTHFVRYSLDGRSTSRTFAVKRQAETFARDIEKLGVARTLSKWDGDPEPVELTLVPEAPPEITLDEWAERYLASVTGLTSGTRYTYRRTYAREWSPALGQLALSAVTREAVAVVINAMTDSDKTIQNRHGVLSTLMKGAIRDRLITYNPCEGMRLPRNTEHLKDPPRFLTLAEYRRLYEATPEQYRPFVALLVGTGIRWGEATGMTVSDFDLDTMKLRITKAVKWSPRRAERKIGPPKTKKARRTIMFGPLVLEAVLPVLAGRRGDELVFADPKDGGFLHNATFSKSVWLPACAKAELYPRPRIHDLRHTHVSWLIDAGVSLPVIRDRLGHESITTTINTYAHLYPSGDQAAADAIDQDFARIGGVETLAPLAIAR